MLECVYRELCEHKNDEWSVLEVLWSSKNSKRRKRRKFNGAPLPNVLETRAIGTGWPKEVLLQLED